MATTDQNKTLSDRMKQSERWGPILYTIKKMRWWIIWTPIVLVVLRMSPGITDPCGTAIKRIEGWKEIERNKHNRDFYSGQHLQNYQARSNQLEFEKYLACKEWKQVNPSKNN